MDKGVYPTEYSHTNHFLSFTSRAFNVTQSQPVSGMSALWKNGKYCGWFIGRFTKTYLAVQYEVKISFCHKAMFTAVYLTKCSSLFCNIAALEINRKFQWCQIEVIIQTNNILYKCKLVSWGYPLKNRQCVANSTNSIKSRETFRLTESVRTETMLDLTTFLGDIDKMYWAR